MKKKAYLTLLIITILCLVFVAVACQPDDADVNDPSQTTQPNDVGNEPSQTAPQIVVSDKDIFEITLSAPTNGDKYAEGETVTATVVSYDGYIVKSLKVNDSIYPVRNGMATFNVKADTNEIAPVYVRTMTEEILANLKKYMKIEGDYVQDILDDSYADGEVHVCTTFADNMIWTVEYDNATGRKVTDLLYGNSGGYLVQFERTMNNEVVFMASNERFSEYYNPFLLLSSKDFILLENGKYSLADEYSAKNAATAITGYVESIDDFFVTVADDGIPVSIYIKTKEINLNGISYIATYDFTVSEVGTAVVPESRYTPYPTTEEHKVLTDALSGLLDAEKYSIRHQGHELGIPDELQGTAGYEDTDYKVYVVRDDIIFDSYRGEEHGYKLLNGYVYPFYLNAADSNIVLSDPLNTVMSALTADPTQFKAEMFEFIEETQDGLLIFNVRENGYSPAFAPYFGEGADEQKYYGYATDMSITVTENGVLHSVKLTTATYGLQEEVTLTYDFETDFSEVLEKLDFENASKQSVLDPFKGDYADKDGNFCKVDNHGFIFNGLEIEISGYDSEYGTFSGTWDGNSVYVTKWSEKQLLIQSEDGTLSYILTDVNVADVVIPDKFHGTWQIDNDEQDLHYVFRLQTYAAWLNDNEMTVLSYTEKEGLSLSLDGISYNFYYDEENTMRVLEMHGDAVYVDFPVEKISDNAGIEIPTEYVGYYVNDDGDRKVVITYAKITVNGTEYKITEYSAQTGFVGTLGQTTDYQISFYYEDKNRIIIGTQTDAHVLKRTESLKDNYIGIWQTTITDFGTEKPYSFTFVITETTISVTADYYIRQGEEYLHYSYENRQLAFTFGEYGYAFELEGYAFTKYILFGYNQFGNPYMVLFDNNGFTVYLQHVEPQLLPKEYVGKWQYTDENKTYEAILASDGSAKVKLGTNAQINVNGTYDKDNNRYEFSYSGKTYYLIFKTDAINLYAVGVVDVNLSRIIEIPVPEIYYGSWISSSGNLTLEVVLSKNSFLVKFDGEEDYTAITDLTQDDENIYVFTYNGEEYVLDTAYGEDTFIIMNSDYSNYKYANMTKNSNQNE